METQIGIRKVTVDIAGHQVSLFTDASPEKVQATVALVNKTMESVLSSTKAPMTHKVALLGSIHLAERVLVLEEQLAYLRKQATDITDRTLSVINNILEPQ